ncbi:MAG: fibronectin type III domain-containing protein [Gammaproteobacteria bacterium]|nr:fibronectin type III domain-containing protein [Gammaproteobacteria bacterium]MDH5802223.1 fibronectin type III domain-containing protein [Gammaproteobacteria bacterium]
MKNLLLLFLLLTLSACGGSENSAQQQTPQDEQAPVFNGISIATTQNASSIKLEWSAAQDDRTDSANLVYLIYVAETASSQDFSRASHQSLAGALTYTVDGLEADRTYYFVVRARDTAGNTDANTVEASATTLSPPADTVPPTFSGISSANSTLAGIELRWAAANDNQSASQAIRYAIYIAQASGTHDFSNPDVTALAGSVSYTLTGLAPGNTYYFVVRAMDEAGNLDTNTVEAQVNIPQAPDTRPPVFAGIVSASGSVDGILLRWNAASDNESPSVSIAYDIYVSTSSGAQNYSNPNYSSVAGSTSYQVTDLPVGQIFYFVVRARDGTGNRDNNSVERSAKIPDVTAPQFAGLQSATPTGIHSIDLEWRTASDNVSAGADLVYDVYIATTSRTQNFSTASYTSTPGATSLRIDGLNEATRYYFVVRARDESGNRDSNTVEVTTTTLDATPPVFQGITDAFSIGRNSIELSWRPALDNNDGQQVLYDIYMSTNSGGQDFTTPSYTTEVGITFFFVTGLNHSTTYYFVVRARDNSGNRENNTVEHSVTTEDGTAPLFSGLARATVVSSSQIDLSWNPASDNVSSAGQIIYEIYMSVGSEPINYNSQSTATSPGMQTFSVNGLIQNTQYNFSVRARDDAGNLDSNTIQLSATTLDATPPVFTGLQGTTVINGSTVELNWIAAVDNLSESVNLVYDIFLAATSGEQDFSTPDFTTAPGVTTFQATGLNDSRTYFFVVRARDEAGNRDLNTVELSVTTPDETSPIFSGVSRVIARSSREIYLTWSAASDNVSAGNTIVYNIYMSTVSGGQDFSTPNYSVTTLDKLITGLDDYTNYYFVVRAKDQAGNLDGNLNERSTRTPDGTAPTFAGLASATAVSASEILLSWEPASDNVTTSENIIYEIYHSSIHLSIPDYTSPRGATSFLVSGLSDFRTYYFVVRARDEHGLNDGNSISMGATTIDGTSPQFSGLNSVYTVSNSELRLNWSDAIDNGTNAANMVYDIYASTTSGGQDFTTPNYSVTGATSYIIGGLQESGRYFYVVRARDLEGNQDTNTVELRGIPEITPPSFSGLSTISSSGTQIQLSWPAANDNSSLSGNIRYHIYVSETAGTQNFNEPPHYITHPGVTHYTLYNMAGGRTYYVTVRARDEARNVDTNQVELSASIPITYGRYVVTSNPGTKILSSYWLDNDSGRLKLIDQFQMDNTPIGLAIHPNGQYAYVAISEGGKFRYDLSNGRLDEVYRGFSFNPTTGIAMHPSGRFIYSVSSRGSSNNVVSGASIDPVSGSTSGINSVTVGNFARHAAMHPSGKYLYSINREIDTRLPTISQFSIDQTTGALTPMVPGVVPAIATGKPTVDPSGRWLFIQYSSEYYSIGPDGSLEPAPQPLPGRFYGVNKGPSGKYVYIALSEPEVADTTTGQYSIDEEGNIRKLMSIEAFGSSGIVVDPLGSYMYGFSVMVHQMLVNADGSLSQNAPHVIRYDESSGASGWSSDMDMGIGNVPAAPVGGIAFVANQGSGDISQFIFGADGMLQPNTPATVSLGPNNPSPKIIALNHTGKRAYINRHSGSVELFDIDLTGNLILRNQGAISVGGGPRAIATNNAGDYLFAANMQNGYVVTFNEDPVDGLVRIPIAITNTGSGPYDSVMHPTGQYYYVTNQFSANLNQYTVDRTHNFVIPVLEPMRPATVATGSYPLSIAIHPSGNYAYVSNRRSDNVSQFNVTPTGSLVPMSIATVTTELDPNAIAVHPTGHYAYVVNETSNTVSQYNVQADGSLTPMTTATVPTGINPTHIHAEASGNYIYVTNKTSNTVSQYTVGIDGGLNPMSTPSVRTGTQPVYFNSFVTYQ